jgi:hypothetical protein
MASCVGRECPIEAHKKFRIRFEVEDTGTRGERFKLQYSRNVTGWKDAQAYPDNDPDNAPSTPEVWVVTSAQYNDGDKTTDLLSRSTAPFVIGRGKETPLTGEIRLRGSQTDVEFTIEIPTFHDVRGKTRPATRSIFGWCNRITPLSPVHSQTRGLLSLFRRDSWARLTLKVPTGSSPSGTATTSTRSSNLLRRITIHGHQERRRGGRTSTEQDGANRPDTDDPESVDAVLAGDELHIVHHDGRRLVYHVFRVSTHPDKNPTRIGSQMY